MNSEWRAFLEDAGAVVIDGVVRHFGNPAQETQVATTGGVIADLSHWAFIVARGADAAKFLQGQLTANIEEVRENRSRLGAHCSPKGRMLVCFRVLKRNDAYYLSLPMELLEPAVKRLRMYILMSKVALEHANDTLLHIGYSAPNGDKLLHEALGVIPQDVDTVAHPDGLTVVRIPGPHPRYEIMGERDALQKLWTKLDVHATPVGAGAWELLDIRAGIPTIYPQTVDAFVPQMANLDLIGGVSFKKGCYTGQEIVARTHYLGRLKRRMYRLHCNVDTLPQPGAPIFNPSTGAGESVGTVVTAQASPDGGVEMLAVLQIEGAKAGELRLGDSAGAQCEIRSLPYSVEDGAH